MTLAALNKNSLLNIEAAGPRYSPIVDPNAPNLEIAPLVSAIETLSLTDKYRTSIDEMEADLKKEWKATSAEIINLFPDKTPKKLIKYLSSLKSQKPGTSQRNLKNIKKSAEVVSNVLQDETSRLWGVERTFKEHTEEWRTIQSQLSRVRDLEKVIAPILSLIRNKNFELVETNRLLLLGEWGSGKTHLLCDISKDRISRNLPTLFLLAHRLPQNVDPLTAICKDTKLTTTPKKLLKELNDLGKATKTRSLLIIDGINEADRIVWKKNIPKILSLMESYKNVGLILSCRSPFDSQLLAKPSRDKFISLFHNGFQEIEFNAQRVFFKYYKIPNPHIPLLTPEFSRPLFLKILCSTFSGQTSTTKSRWINEIASGQKSMTKLFEDFVSQIGAKIEANFGLSAKTCWKILKGAQAVDGKIMGIAVSMANHVKDYIDPKETLNIIKELSGKSKTESLTIFRQMVIEGLLVEDTVWDGTTQKNIIRLPYQRFSDHLISRHLLKEYLNVKSENSIRSSFHKNRPLGKIFGIDKYGRNYNMPGLASAIMLEFPERVKNTLPTGEREVVYYLPKNKRLVSPMVDAFLEGVLWRSKDSFSTHTDNIFGYLLDSKDEQIQSRTLESLVSLACRPNHPYSANRLYKYLSKKTLIERDLLWSEFLRNSYLESVVHRVLNWIEDSIKLPIDKGTAENLIMLLSLFLTTTDRPLRDRVTKCLVIIGERQSEPLLKLTIDSLSFDDPYIPERMLAASYGVLMRSWAFPSVGLQESVVDFCNNLYDSLFGVGAPNATTHILMRDYALGCIELSRKINIKCLSKRPLKNLKAPYQPPRVKIPKARRISEVSSAPAKSAIYMDFENYTIGRLVVGRHNYESEHKEYRGVLKQIKWRILSLGYRETLFKDIDRSISQRSFYREKRQDAGKVDRYGKKYSWIAFFEVAGLRSEQGLLPDRYIPRISDTDIDPSFPEQPKVWQPILKKFFVKKSKTPKAWIVNGKAPNYEHLLRLETVDKIKGPWILLGGYINESAPKDTRKVFTFLNCVLVNEKNVTKLRNKFNSKKYPGNNEIPTAWQDYYTFFGEVPWSKKYGGEFHKLGQISKVHKDSCFEEHKNFTIRKKTSELTAAELSRVNFSKIKIVWALEENSEPKVEEIKEKKIPKYTELHEYKTIPGIDVEVPIHSLSWESYHSTENQTGGADFIAPALCDFLNLKNKGTSQDLFDKDGKQASVFRIFGDSSEYFKSTLLYIRKDLLESYLEHTKQKLACFMWGERDFKYEEKMAQREELQDIWSSYRHIHKKLKIIRL